MICFEHSEVFDKTLHQVLLGIQESETPISNAIKMST